MAYRPASRALLACLILFAIGCASADLPHSDGTKEERAHACAKYAPLYANIDLDLAPWAEAGISSDLVNQSMHAYDHTPRQKVKASLHSLPTLNVPVVAHPLHSPHDRIPHCRS